MCYQNRAVHRYISMNGNRSVLNKRKFVMKPELKEAVKKWLLGILVFGVVLSMVLIIENIIQSIEYLQPLFTFIREVRKWTIWM